MPYTIEVHYSTGDSFHTHEENHDIGLVWNDKQLAIKALSHIKEQHQLYKQLDLTYGKKEQEELINSIVSKEWVQNIDNSLDKKDYWTYCLSSLMDDGSYRTISIIWLGYFENLISAKVKEINSDQVEEEYIPN